MEVDDVGGELERRAIPKVDPEIGGLASDGLDVATPGSVPAFADAEEFGSCVVRGSLRAETILVEDCEIHAASAAAIVEERRVDEPQIRGWLAHLPGRHARSAYATGAWTRC